MLTNFATDTKPIFFPPFGRSDHLVISWKPVAPSRVQAEKLRIHNISGRNLLRFDSSVSLVNWLAFIDSYSDVNIATDVFLNCLFSLFDLSFPSFHRSTWLRNSLKILFDDGDRAFRKQQWARYHRLNEEVVHYSRQLKSTFIIKTAVKSPEPN